MLIIQGLVAFYSLELWRSMFEEAILWSGSFQYLAVMYIYRSLNIGKDSSFIEISNICWRIQENDVGIEIPANIGTDILIPNTKEYNIEPHLSHLIVS